MQKKCNDKNIRIKSGKTFKKSEGLNRAQRRQLLQDKNLSIICEANLKEIPNWKTIQDVIEELDYNEIDAIRKYMFNALLRSKMFDKFRYNSCIQLVVDATGLTALDYNLNGNCLTRTRNGKTKYYKYVLETKVVFGNMLISIDSE